MDIVITRAEKGDFPYIKEKIGKYLLDGRNIDWSQFFVARAKSGVVAFGRIIDHGKFYEVASLGVDYYQRKKGLGKKMLKFLLKEAKRQDARKPVYGVTHISGFAASCGLVPVCDNLPQALEDKRRHGCRLAPSRISIVKWQG